MIAKKVDDLIKDLQNIKQEYGNLPLVYAIDDEGNAFREVFYSPSPGEYTERDFNSSIEELNDSDINAVCIN